MANNADKQESTKVDFLTQDLKDAAYKIVCDTLSDAKTKLAELASKSVAKKNDLASAMLIYQNLESFANGIFGSKTGWKAKLQRERAKK